MKKSVLFLVLCLLMGTSAQAADIAYAKEILTVSTSAVPMTASVYQKKPETSRSDLESAFITCEGADVRFLFTGDTPTSSVGHYLSAGQQVTITGYKNLQNFLAIRAGGSNGTLVITYMRKLQ